MLSWSCERGEQDYFGNEAMIYLIHLGLIYAELLVIRSAVNYLLFAVIRPAAVTKILLSRHSVIGF